MNTFVFLKALWHKKIFIIYMCLLGAVAALSFKSLAFKDVYTYVLNYYITNSELSKLLVDVNSLQADIQMSESCRIMLKSELALDTVGEMLLDKYGEDYLSQYFTINETEAGAEISYDELSDCIEISEVDDGTAALEVKVTSENPYIATDIGQFLTYVAPHIIYYYVGADYISPYENAKLSLNEGLPGNKKTALIGAAAGMFLAAGIVFMAGLLTKSVITDDRDVKAAANLVVLGTIPYYTMKNAD